MIDQIHAASRPSVVGGATISSMMESPKPAGLRQALGARHAKGRTIQSPKFPTQAHAQGMRGHISKPDKLQS